MAVRTFLLLAILVPQAASKQFLSKAVVDDDDLSQAVVGDDDLSQVTFGDCKEVAKEESLIQESLIQGTGIPARCKCRPFGKGCPKFRLWIDNREVPMAAMHLVKKGGKRVKGMKGKWKAGRGPPTKKRKTARLAKKSSDLADASSALVKDTKEDNQVPIVKSNEDDDEEWVWTPKGVGAIKKEHVEKQMGAPAAGDDVSVAAKNYMNQHGTAGSAIEYGMIKTAHQTEKAVKLFSANDEEGDDEEGEKILNPFLKDDENAETSDQEEDSDAAVEEDGSDSDDAEEGTEDGAEVESFLQTHSENLHLSAATQAKHELADKLLAAVHLGSHPSIPARCKCKPFGKGCPKFRLWIDGKEVPMSSMHKVKRGGKRVKGMKGQWKAGRGPPTRKRKNARLAKTSSGLAKESSALAKDDKVPVVTSNGDDDEAWVWTRKGVGAIKQEGVEKNMSFPAAGEEVSVAAKNFMNKHGSAGQAIAHGMIKTSEGADAGSEDDMDTDVTSALAKDDESGADVDEDEADVEDDAEGADSTEVADEQEQGFDEETDEVDDQQ